MFNSSAAHFKRRKRLVLFLHLQPPSISGFPPCSPLPTPPLLPPLLSLPPPSLLPPLCSPSTMLLNLHFSLSNFLYCHVMSCDMWGFPQELGKLLNRTERLEGDTIDVQLQIMELQEEKAGLQKELVERTNEHQRRVSELKAERDSRVASLVEQLTLLQQAVTEVGFERCYCHSLYRCMFCTLTSPPSPPLCTSLTSPVYLPHLPCVPPSPPLCTSLTSPVYLPHLPCVPPSPPLCTSLTSPVYTHFVPSLTFLYHAGTFLCHAGTFLCHAGTFLCHAGTFLCHAGLSLQKDKLSKDQTSQLSELKAKVKTLESR